MEHFVESPDQPAENQSQKRAISRSEHVMEVPNTSNAIVAINAESLPIEIVLELSGLRNEIHNPNNGQTFALDIDRLDIPSRSFMSILGGTGCGKTTLLTLLGLLRRPSRRDGSQAVDSFVIHDEGPNEYPIMEQWEIGSSVVANLRRRLVGFCLQSGDLLPNLTVFENVSLPMSINGWSGKKIRHRVDEILIALSENQQNPELLEKKSSLPRSLSGGQQQRVALARSIAHRPKIMFLDEPTGSLDKATAKRAVSVVSAMKNDSSIVMITHDRDLAEEFSDYIIEMGRPAQQLNCDNTDLEFALSRGTILNYRRKVAGVWSMANSRWDILR